MHTVLVVIVVIGGVAYVIGRQLLGEPQRAKRLLVLPAVLTVVGAVDLGRDGRHPQPIDAVFIALSALLAIGIGLRQGAIMHLESRDGGLWGRMPVRSLWLWAALVAGRLAIGGIAEVSGAHVAASTAPILLVLGINRLAQAASITLRAVHAGIPLAPASPGAAPVTGSAVGRRAGAPTRTVWGPDTSDGGVAPRTTSWESAGRQVMVALGTALQDRRERRRPRERRRR